MERNFKIKLPSFCTQSALETINELNISRQQKNQKLIFLSKSLYRAIEKEQYNYNEIYPQQIIDNLKHRLLK